jgi:hypothetical protein
VSSQKFLISVLALVCCVVPASASLVTYCSLGACTDASSGFASATSDDTFQNIVASTGNLGTSFTDDGVLFANPAGMTGISSLGGAWPAGVTIVANATSSGNTITLTLPAGVSAIEFYVGPQDYSDFGIAVTDSLGGNFNYQAFETNPTTTPVFFGVTSTGTLTSVTVTSFSPPDKITLDDVSFGGDDASPTPEAATLLLVATGLVAMGYMRRRTPRRAPAGRPSACALPVVTTA